MSAVVPAMASELHVTDDNWNESKSGYIGESDVTLEVVDEGGGEDPVIFSAYVPSTLPIVMDLSGKITVPTNAVIRNGVETKDIKVSAINVTAANGWSLASFDGVAGLADDQKAIGMKLNSDAMAENGQVALTDGNWVIAKTEGDPEKGKLPPEHGSCHPQADRPHGWRCQ